MTPDMLPARFASKIVTGTGCWGFTGATTSRGYGSLSHEGRIWSAHRLAYTLLVGPIPDGMTIDHLCFNKRCCNPAHLEAVTGSENTRRAFAAGVSKSPTAIRNSAKTRCDRGHEFNAGNTYIDHRGHRQCRECKRASDKRANDRRIRGAA